MEHKIIKKSCLRGKEYLLFEIKRECFFYVVDELDFSDFQESPGWPDNNGNYNVDKYTFPLLKQVALELKVLGKVRYDREIVPEILYIEVPEWVCSNLGDKIRKYYKEYFPKYEIMIVLK